MASIASPPRMRREAKRIASQFGPTPMLARIDAELAELA
jgi:hypothetical protein